MDKGQARVGDKARERLVRALLQDGFDHPDDDSTALTLSQAADRAGLSRPAVVAVRDRLRPFLREPKGRGAQSVALDPAQGVAVGVEFRQDELTVCLADLFGRPIAEPKQVSKGLEEDPRLTLDRAAQLITQSLAEAKRGSEAVVGVGISLAHPVDPRESGAVRALSPGDDHGWRLWEGVGDVRQQLRQRLRWTGSEAPSLERFVADNDANLSAYAEGRWGALRENRHALYVFWGDGIGSGVLVDGEVDHGVGGIAGAIGHMPVIEGTEAKHCPRCGLLGCLETVASGRAILSRVGLDVTPEGIERLVAEASKDRASPAYRALDEGAFQLGRALGICLHLFNPEAIVIGGGFGFEVFELVRSEGLERGLRRQAVPSALDDLNIGGLHRGRFATHTGVRGAVARVLWEFLPDYLGGLPAD
jgi:predicted NBD/HSP70 family sugar kinase